MDKYVQLCETRHRKRQIIPYSDLIDDKKLKTYICKSPGLDWYSSLFTYNKDIKDYFESNNDSVAGYKGPAEASYLFFDLDNKTDLEAARKDTRTLLNLLKNKLNTNKISNHVSIYFSGKKGFHVYLHTKQNFDAKEMEHYCKVLANGIHSFDGSIYQSIRIIRIENTKHAESKLYKIELHPQELIDLSIDDIKELAKNPRNKQDDKVDRVIRALDVQKFISENKNKTETKEEKSVIVSEEEIDGIRGLENIDFNKCPDDTPRCIYAMQQGIMKSGDGKRNDIFVHLGNFFRNRGHDRETTLNLLLTIANKNARLYPEHKSYHNEIKQNVMSRVFNGGFFNKGGWGTSPDDETFKKYCKAVGEVTNIKCSMHEEEEDADTSSLVKISDVSDSFENFAENFDKNVVRTGINFIDDHMKITSKTLNLIVGAAGSGKTSLALNILEKANALGIHCVFFSMDMGKDLIYLKLAQKLTNFSQNEIFRIYEEKDEAKKKIINDAVAKKYDKTFFDFTGALTMNDMKDRVLAIEEASGNKVKLVLVDYASRITGRFSDAYSNAKENALRSKDVADETDAAWLIICQVSRNTGNGSTPLRTKRAAKDAGDWEEAATNVITCWRPFMGKHNKELIVKGEEGDVDKIILKDNIMRLFLAKNRIGKEIEKPLHWTGAKGLVEDMDDEDYRIYKEEYEPYEDTPINNNGNKFFGRN